MLSPVRSSTTNRPSIVRFWLGWVVACGGGWALAGALIVLQPDVGFRLPRPLLDLFFCALLLAAVAVPQSIALRHRLRSAWAWSLATVVALPAALGLGAFTGGSVAYEISRALHPRTPGLGPLETAVMAILVGAVIGASLGGAQALVLWREGRPGGAWWRVSVGAAIAAMLAFLFNPAGAAFGYIGPTHPWPGRRLLFFLALYLAVSGTVYGAVTGLPLARLLPRSSDQTCCPKVRD
jgi:hypothetical protein